MRKLWNKYEDQLMRICYPHLSCTDMVEILGRSKSSIYGRASVLKLEKSDYFKQNFAGRLTGVSGHAHRYKKGHVPANKGKEMSFQTREKCKHTWFCKGNLPHNTLHDGAISIRTDNRGVKEPFIRITKAKWIHLRIYVWCQYNGPVKDGMFISHKDGDTMNCQIENLEEISPEENMHRNSIHNYSPEIKSLIRINSKLKKAINNA